ncbi:hypothetical protein [Cellulomonas sp. B6]|uniref:hypothetical protein n=1 Tax=Cellulomonas sp. B6 TaxID=1295626 RepID=UPI00073B912C|nr:hypothetical protein [Cellulomonas sp. B6]KSW30014.1 hypothetical protein ATM99_05090 [Cellulomonas sp. B6]
MSAAVVHAPGADVQLLSLTATADWRTHPDVRAAVAAAALAAGAEPGPALDEVVAAVLSPARYVHAVGGACVGVSASHEAGRTYVAVAPAAVVVDACAMDRWAQVTTAGSRAFTAAERAAVRTPWDAVRAWTALECAVKAGGADLLRPDDRAPLLVPGAHGVPVVPGEGAGLHLVHHAGRLRAVCVRVAVAVGARVPAPRPAPDQAALALAAVPA